MKCIKINVSDSVAVAIERLSAGDTVTVGGRTLDVLDDIEKGHKLALCDIAPGEKVIKYGYPIGHARRGIKAGECIHTHNLASDLSGELCYSYRPDFCELTREMPLTFNGYRRKDGRVGIRNEVWIIPTVGCVNAVVREIEAASQQFKTQNIDGIYAYNHPYGCSQLGDDMNMTLSFIAGLIRNPNAAGVVVVGLGCENGNIDELKKLMPDIDGDRVKFLSAQDCEDEVKLGTELVKQLAAAADSCRRESCPASELVIGLKCGGSDGLSGITANPLVGALSDRVIAMGGSTLLTEVPEMFGAETILMNRCRGVREFEKTVQLINGFKEYFMRYGEKVDENPSPGNKAGGITTLEDKSLGCVQKGGRAPVEDVLDYGEGVRTKGLSLLRAPGNDLVASNALAASGAQLILFTTGRGTPFGCPVPTVKISSNTELALRKKHWIDFDAGVFVSGTDIGTLTDIFLDYILKLASGEVRTVSETQDKHELAIFKDGVTL